MNGERMVMIAGWADTRAAFRRWNVAPVRTIGPWLALSTAIGLGLLVATWALSHRISADPQQVGSTLLGPRTFGVAWSIFRRNLLVLALHSLVCVAGYMATASVQTAAHSYTGWVRRAHLLAVPVTLVFVGCMTVGSLTVQTVALARAAAELAPACHVSVAHLLVLLLPHALPELAALFLPLAAWLLLVRRDRWTELFAASMLATTIALPLLFMAALIETWVTPALLQPLT